MHGTGSSVHGVGAKDGCGRPWHAGVGIMIFFTLLWIAGLVLLIVGLNEKAESNNYTPSEFFELTASGGGGCKVLSMVHRADQRQDKNPFCVDVYTYTFIKTSATGANYTSGPDEQSRGKGTRCSSSVAKPNSLKVGAVTDCWDLKASKTRTDAEGFYTCGNAACVKVLSPTLWWEDKRDTADLLSSLGSVFLGVGLPACGILGFVVSRCRMQQDAIAAVGANNGYGSTTGAAGAKADQEPDATSRNSFEGA